MMKSAYVDTNIFDYAALRNPTYGRACVEILEGIGKEFDAVCSISVPLEIFGSLSRKDIGVAYGTLTAFFSFDLKLVNISKDILLGAAGISKKTGINGYDAVHAATMESEGITSIITENHKDFEMVKDIRVVRPLGYGRWLNSAL